MKPTLFRDRPHSPTLLVALLAFGLAAAGCDKSAVQRAEESESVFGFLSPTKPADAARWMVDPFNPEKRYLGTNMIANASFGGERVYVEMYALKLGAAGEPDPDPGVRGIAARALGMHGDPKHVDLILPLLNEKDRLVRLEAVRALQRLHNPKAVDALLNALSDKKETDPDIRAEAATALGQYAEIRVLQSLISALDDDALTVTNASLASLDTLTGFQFGEDQRVWLVWLTNNPAPFAGRKQYIYPVFYRDYFWYEYLPFVNPPPNEIAASPVGLMPSGLADPNATRAPGTVAPVGGPNIPAGK